ncbi:hypothetical protein FLJC2902T_22600 [Flavobacterium limnosediminis JC2902]|uniref:Uncharacterized protein n=1 Tax=Flavobacterium limnosediminis JC2902 TaxID=1341181 RepID=V6SLE2_9FLAO|nr:hypothetical protein FLJC2902T_22600 [Flavobacterium limnosediminis JC2902]
MSGEGLLPMFAGFKMCEIPSVFDVVAKFCEGLHFGCFHNYWF